MSSFKRTLSMILAVVMVLSTCSCLAGVFTFGASAAEGTSHILSKAELEGSADVTNPKFSADCTTKPYIYMGIEYYESDGKLTDYYVDAGETLTAFLYLKSNMYFSTQTIYLEYDNTFFDVTNGSGQYLSNQTMPTNSYVPGSTTTYKNFAFNSAHTDAMAVGINGTWLESKATKVTNAATRYPELADQLSDMDVISTSTKRDTAENVRYKLDTEAYFYTFQIKVNSDVEDNAKGSGGALINLYAAYKSSMTGNQRLGKFSVATTSSAIGRDSVSCGVYNDAGNFLLDDAYATFTCGKNPEDEGGGGDGGSTEGTSVVKSKAYFEGSADVTNPKFSADCTTKPYIYMAIDYYESNGKLTDYYVDAGETLTAFLYLKSNMYFSTQTIYLEYDNTFFDVTNGSGQYLSNQTMPTNSYVPGSTTTYQNFAFNSAHTDAMAVGINGTWLESKATKVTNAATRYPELADQLSDMDVISTSTKRDTAENVRYKLDTEAYFYTFQIKVNSDVENNAKGSGGALINLYAAYKNSMTGNQRLGKFSVATTSSAIGRDSVVCGVYNEAGNFLLDDAYATFTCGKNPGSGGTKYTATFKVDGEVYGDVLSYASGASITVPSTNPSKSGYSFKGWAVEGTTNVVTSFVMGSAAVTYVAVFEAAATYTATFKVDGAVYGDVLSYATGATIVAPADPSKTGYTFSGWSPSVGTMGTSNAVFTAQFTANTYNVTFKSEGSQFAKNSVKFDGTYNTAVGTPTKTGYVFSRWEDANGNAMPTTHTVASDVTYYAKFTAGTFNAIFNAGSGKFADQTSTKTVPTVFGQAIAAPADPTQSGYDFGGWSPAVGTMDTEGKTFNAVWNAKQIGVTFMDGASVLDTKTGDFGSQITAIANPEKTGYNFAGWEYSDHSTVSFPITLGESAITVYAKWNAKSYYIEFVNGDDVVDGGNQTFGTNIQTPTSPSKPGYDFVGWVDADGNAMPATVPAAATTYYAKFNAKYYNAVFKIFATDTVAYDTKSVAFGEVIPAPTTPEDITGYDFISWVKEGTDTALTSTSKMPVNGVTYVAKLDAKTYNVIFYVDGKEVYRTTAKYGAAVPGYNYTPASGSSFSGWGSVPSSMPASDLSLYGTTGTSTYKVTFNVNNVYYSEANVTFGAQVNAPSYIVPEGHSFSGWDLPTSMPASNITLNATLKKNSYAVNYYLFEDDTEAYATYKIEYGAEITVPDEPEIAGYDFNGWDCEEETMPANALNIYADLTRIEYAIEFTDKDGVIVDGYDWTAYYGDKIQAAQAPTVTKEGFEFKYWMVDGERIAFPYTVTGDTTFEPYFGIQGYDINYYVDGVIKYTDTYTFGQTIVIRADLSKDGYTFSGWTDAPDFDTMPANDIDIHGTFTAITYDAKFYLSQEDLDNDATPYATVPTDFDKVPVAPANPEKDGYSFIGWTPVLSKMVVGGANYVARFSVGASNYTINVYTMGTDGKYGDPATEVRSEATDATVTYTPTIKTGFTVSTDSVLSGTVTSDNALALNIYYARNKYKLITVVDDVETPTEYYYDQAVVAPDDPEKTGYSFRSWNAEIPEKMPAKDVKLTARFSINQYTITFDTAGGTTIKAIKADYMSLINAPVNPTKTGHNFDGWDKAIPTSMPAYDMTITAKWKINQYTITFADTGDSTINPITDDYGATVTAPADPEKVGHTFAGWDVKIPETMPAESITITAKWTVNNYNATFVIGSENKVVPTPYGQIPVAPEAVKLGHTFDNWDSELAPMGVDGATYTAVFHANNYDAEFDANEGKFDDLSVTKKVSVEFGQEVTAPADPTREGYTFAGWSPVVGIMDAEGITYTAQWNQDLNYCRVKEVNRVTQNVYKAGIADYTVKVEGSPVKIMFAYVEGGTSSVTWTYDRRDTAIDTSVQYATGLVSIVAYDSNDLVTTDASAVAYEIWTIRAVYTEGNYRVRAKVSNSEDSWESFDVAKEFVNTYDIAPVDETIIKSTAVDTTTVKRGEYATFTIVVKDSVSRIRFVRDVEGTLTTVAFSTTSSEDLVTITDAGDGYKAWVIKLRLSFNTTDEFENQTWKIQYRETGKTKWIDSDKGDYTFKVTRYQETVEAGEGETPHVLKYEVVSIDAPTTTVSKGSYAEVKVVVTSEVTRVRLVIGTKSSTYLATSKNCTVVDNGDGTSTWTINYRFAVAGDLNCGVQVRGNAWSEATGFNVKVN